MRGYFGSLTQVAGTPYSASAGGTVKDINEVLRRKKTQLEVLGKQITQLQEAAENLRSIAHLLQDDENEQGHPAGR